ncbi:MAG: ABC transporter permease [Lachnospiraceae bacterium]|nr:ABC transporter permease [Lachnospiraceae bacterium]
MKREEKSAVIQNLLMGNKALLIVIALGVILSIASPAFLTSSNLLNVVRQVCVSTLLSIGFTIVLSSGNMDLSIGTLMGLCGMILAKLVKEAGVPLPAAILIVFGVAVFGGLLNAAILSLFSVPAFIVTLATQSIFKGVNYLISDLVPVSGLPSELLFLGQGYLFGIPMPIYIMLLVVLAVWVMMNRTKFGRYILAVGGNAEAARASGINTKRINFGVYICCGLCAGVASIIMTGRVGSAQVGAGVGMEMDAIAAVVIGGTSMSGGKANVWGTLFGCLLVGIVNNGMNLLGINPNWQVIAKGFLILFAVIIDVVSARAQAKRLNRIAQMQNS